MAFFATGGAILGGSLGAGTFLGASGGALLGGALGSSVAGSLGGGGGSRAGGGSTSSPPVYIPQNQPGMDTNYQNSFNQYQNAINQYYGPLMGMGGPPTAAPMPAAPSIQQPQPQPQQSSNFNQSGFNPQYSNRYGRHQNDIPQPLSAAPDTTGMQGHVTGTQGLPAPSQSGQPTPFTPSPITSAYQQIYNNPQAQGMQNSANQAGQIAQGLLPQQQAAIQGMYGAGNNMLSAGNTVFNTAMDPQQALYNRTQQQLQDQVRAASSAAGVGTSPYGAGLENQAMSNFNIDWQNQQLQRQMQGLSGLNVANHGYAADMAGASALGDSTMQTAQNIGGIPYNAANTIGTNQFGAITSYQNALTPYFQQMGNSMNQAGAYMDIGSSAQQNAFNQASLNQAYNNQQQQQAGSNFAQSGLGNVFSGIFGGNSGQTPDFFSSNPWANPLVGGPRQF